MQDIILHENFFQSFRGNYHKILISPQYFLAVVLNRLFQASYNIT